MSLRPLPAVTDDTAAFWEGGVDGRLHIHRCRQCRTWFHPPSPVCPDCLSKDVGAESPSGRATVMAFSINMQPWAPGMVVPYVVGVVSLDDAPGVQLTTRFVDIDPADIAVGQSMEVVFEQVDDVYLPLFRPASDSSADSAARVER